MEHGRVLKAGVGLDAGNCSMGNWGDRFIDVGDIDIVLDVVAYGSCTANPFLESIVSVNYFAAIKTCL